MTTAQAQKITLKKVQEIYELSRKAFETAKKAKKMAFQAETLVSLEEVRLRKVTNYKSAEDLFKKLGI